MTHTLPVKKVGYNFQLRKLRPREVQNLSKDKELKFEPKDSGSTLNLSTTCHRMFQSPWGSGGGGTVTVLALDLSSQPASLHSSAPHRKSISFFAPWLPTFL